VKVPKSSKEEPSDKKKEMKEPLFYKKENVKVSKSSVSLSAKKQPCDKKKKLKLSSINDHSKCSAGSPYARSPYSASFAVSSKLNYDESPPAKFITGNILPSHLHLLYNYHLIRNRKVTFPNHLQHQADPLK